MGGGGGGGEEKTKGKRTKAHKPDWRGSGGVGAAKAKGTKKMTWNGRPRKNKVKQNT